MDGLRIDTGIVESTSDTIKTYNEELFNEYSTVENSVSRMDAAWDSGAATIAITKFNELNSKYPQNRYNVWDNYVNFLYQSVGIGYETKEADNVNLAELFK